MNIVIMLISITCLIAIAVTASVLLVFSQWAFSVLGFHPIAAEFMAGEIDAGVMMIFRWDDQVFTSNEISHFHDVKALLSLLQWICGLALLICPVLFALRRRQFCKSCLWAPVIFIAIGVSTVGAFFVFGFERVGVFFHTIVFPGGNWRFPFDSLMIRLYGTEVMVTGAGVVIAASAIFLIIVALLAYYSPWCNESNLASDD